MIPARVRWQVVLAALVLLAVVGAVFCPILSFSFIDYDVPDQVLNNPYVQGLTIDHLKRIFTSKSAYSYYPIRSLTYAADYQLWGLRPGGFKLTNALIHSANVLLALGLMLRLLARRDRGLAAPIRSGDVVAAAFAAAVFAIHPVVVEPVTWVAGREELLMTLGVLACLHFFTTARGAESQGRGRAVVLAWHGAALVACAVACLSNAVAAVTPLLLVAGDLLAWHRPTVRRALAGVALPAAMAATTILVKNASARTGLMADVVGTFSLDRLWRVLNVYWLNLKSLFWPVDLSLAYREVEPAGVLDPQVLLGALAIAATGAVLWRARRRKRLLFGLVWFGLALGPTSQLMAHHVHRADRFLYLPLGGLAVAVALGVRQLWGITARWRTAVRVTALGVVALLAVRSAGQVQTWRDTTSVWTHALAVDPHNPIAHNELARQRRRQQRWLAALWHHQKAFRRRPADPNILANYAFTLATYPGERVRDFARAFDMAERACDLTGWHVPSFVQTLAVVHGEYAKSLADSGHFAEAVEHFERAVELDPVQPSVLGDFTLLLTTCPDPAWRDAERARELAEEAWRRTGGQDADIRRILATTCNNAAVAMEEQGRFDKALACYQRAVQADPRYDRALRNLALLLATCPDRSLRRPERAVRLIERAWQVADRPSVDDLLIEAEVYAAAGQRDAASAALDAAIHQAAAEGDTATAAELGRRRKSLTGRPGSSEHGSVVPAQ